MSNSKLSEVLLSVKKILSGYKLSQIQLSDKSLIQFDGDELKPGLSVNLLIDSKPSPLPDASYQTLEGISFTIEKGVVSKVDSSKAKSTETKISTPVLQSTEKVEQATSTEEKPGASTVDQPTDGDEVPKKTDDSNKSSLTIDDLQTALAPLLESIKNIETSMCGEMSKQTQMSKELKDVREALSTVTEVVEVIAGEPSAKPIELKKNPWSKKMKILQRVKRGTSFTQTIKKQNKNFKIKYDVI